MISKDSAKSEFENYDKIIAAIEKRKKQFAGKYQGPYLNALKAKLKPPQIKAKCYDCVTEDICDAITDCRGFSCPLYFFRPYQYPDTQKVKTEVMRHFKIFCAHSGSH